jgi:hypothetical protein
MKYGFLHVILELKGNPCIGRHQLPKNSPRMKKARMSKSKFKEMLIVFFDIKGIIFVE